MTFLLSPFTEVIVCSDVHEHLNVFDAWIRVIQLGLYIRFNYLPSPLVITQIIFIHSTHPNPHTYQTHHTHVLHTLYTHTHIWHREAHHKHTHWHTSER